MVFDQIEVFPRIHSIPGISKNGSPQGRTWLQDARLPGGARAATPVPEQCLGSKSMKTKRNHPNPWIPIAFN